MRRNGTFTTGTWNAKLEADARFEVAELAERAVVHPQQRILLDIAADKELLDLRRQACRAAKAVAAAEFVDKVGLCKHAAAVIQNAAETAFERRCIYQPRCGQRPAPRTCRPEEIRY